jgi:hypothetical protein
VAEEGARGAIMEGAGIEDEDGVEVGLEGVEDVVVEG